MGKWVDGLPGRRILLYIWFLFLCWNAHCPSVPVCFFFPGISPNLFSNPAWTPLRESSDCWSGRDVDDVVPFPVQLAAVVLGSRYPDLSSSQNTISLVRNFKLRMLFQSFIVVSFPQNPLCLFPHTPLLLFGRRTGLFLYVVLLTIILFSLNSKTVSFTLVNWYDHFHSSFRLISPSTFRMHLSYFPKPTWKCIKDILFFKCRPELY